MLRFSPQFCLKQRDSIMSMNRVVLIVALFGRLNLFHLPHNVFVWTKKAKQSAKNSAIVLKHQCVPHNTRHRHLFYCQRSEMVFFHSKASDSCNHNNGRTYDCFVGEVICVTAGIDGDNKVENSGCDAIAIPFDVLVCVRDNDSVRNSKSSLLTA